MAKSTKRKANEEVEITPVEDLIAQMEADFKKAYKDDSVTAFNKYVDERPRLWYSTGIASLDIALGGGLAGGRVSEFYGNI